MTYNPPIPLGVANQDVPIPYVPNHRYRYLLSVRFYFDRTYGNTYYSARAVDLLTGEERMIPFAYGRGVEMVMSYMSGERFYGDPVPIWGMTFANTVVESLDVSRRRDMHGNGKHGNAFGFSL